MAEQRITCPEKIMASQVAVTAPTGWKGLLRPGSWLRLTGAVVWTGPLDGEAPGELIGETAKRKDGTVIKRFSGLESEALHTPIAGHGVGAVKGQIERVRLDNWMVCQYEDGSIVQAMKLPKGTKECEVIYRPADPMKKKITVLSDIICR